MKKSPCKCPDRNREIMIHLRMWSENKWDVYTACGLFSRVNSKRRKWKFTNVREFATCPKCNPKIEG